VGDSVGAGSTTCPKKKNENAYGDRRERSHVQHSDFLLVDCSPKYTPVNSFMESGGKQAIFGYSICSNPSDLT
jgi:hypothetical protein